LGKDILRRHSQQNIAEEKGEHMEDEQWLVLLLFNRS